MTRMCCVCNKVEQGGQWQINPTLPEAEPVTHGYCPECYIGAMAEIKEFIGEKAICVGVAGCSPVYGSCGQCV
jgi:hypothetical protein